MRRKRKKQKEGKEEKDGKKRINAVMNKQSQQKSTSPRKIWLCLSAAGEKGEMGERPIWEASGHGLGPNLV